MADVSATRKEWSAKSYYDVLGVPKDASPGQIKKAYYKMARQYHPDQSDDPNAEEIFKVVNEAYHVLIDEEKRATYDKYGKEGVAQTEGGGLDPVDVMKSMFGGDAFADTFGELSMWEQMRMQMMQVEMTEEEAREKLQTFAKERHERLVEALVQKTSSFVSEDLAKFRQVIDADVDEKVAAPGGVSLLAAVGYIYCQVAQQFMDRFLGLGSLFAKVSEKGHKFSNNMSAIGGAVKLAYSSVKLQQKMENEERERQIKWLEEHPEEAKKLYFAQEGVTEETYPYELDEEWLQYKSNVEIPAGADEEAAWKKVKGKWYDEHIALKEMPDFGDAGGDMHEAAAMKVFDQGLKLMWKLGVMEAEEIVREVVRAVCDTKSELNKKLKPSKNELKRRAQAIHHIGEKYKAVAARLKSDKKKGFTVQDFLDKEGDEETSPRKTQSAPAGASSNDNNAEPAPEPAAADPAPPAPANATEDID